MLSSAKYVEDGTEWLNDSGMADVLTMLGFAYSAYKTQTKPVADKRSSAFNDVITSNKNGKKYTIDKSKSTSNPTYKKASGTETIKQPNDFATEPFLPEKYYKNNYSSMDGIPNSRMEYNRLGSSGNVEKSVIIYDS